MRFIALSVVFLIASGVFLHYKMDVPYLSWVGKLPGDIVVRKNNAVIYFPIASSVLTSGVLSLLLFALFKPEK